MKNKLLAIICLIISGVLLGGYFDKKPIGSINSVKKEINGLYTVVYTTFDDLSFLDSPSSYDKSYGNIRVYNVNEVGVPFIMTDNDISSIEEGLKYDLFKSKEICQYKGEHYQVFSLESPKAVHIVRSTLCALP